MAEGQTVQGLKQKACFVEIAKKDCQATHPLLEL